EPIRNTDGLRPEIVPPPRAALGSLPLTVRLWRNDQLVTTRVARFEVLRRFRVAVTRVSLQRDQPVDEKTVQFEQRFLNREVDEPDQQMVLGRKVRSEVKAGTILSLRDLSGPSREPDPVVIRRRDNVRVVAQSGRIQVVLKTAEAQQ